MHLELVGSKIFSSSLEKEKVKSIKVFALGHFFRRVHSREGKIACTDTFWSVRREGSKGVFYYNSASLDERLASPQVAGLGLMQR